MIRLRRPTYLLLRLRMIRSAPPNNASALTPEPGSISGTGAADATAAMPTSTKAIPTYLMEWDSRLLSECGNRLIVGKTEQEVNFSGPLRRSTRRN